MLAANRVVEFGVKNDVYAKKRVSPFNKKLLTHKMPVLLNFIFADWNKKKKILFKIITQALAQEKCNPIAL